LGRKVGKEEIIEESRPHYVLEIQDIKIEHKSDFINNKEE
jgi:hypothetical protein